MNTYVPSASKLMMNNFKNHIRKILLESFEEIKKIPKLSSVNLHRYFFVLNLLNKFSEGKFRGKSLDIGCGSGILCIAMKKLGYSVYGVDVFEDNNGKFKEMGINYKICNWGRDLLPFDNEIFDVITCLEVLEHLVYSPLKALENVHRVLKKDGLLILTTPNLVSLNNRFRMLRGKSIFWDLKNYYINEENIPARHNREYILKEVITILNLSKFNIIKCGYFSTRTWPIRSVMDYFNNITGVLRDIVPFFRKSIFAVCKK